MANAKPNLAPGFTFFIAWACRLEKVQLSCKYSKVKIAGTALCVIGAFVMNLMQSFVDAHTAKVAQSSVPSAPAAEIFDGGKIIGSLFLLAAVFVLSSTIVLQAATLSEIPAPISLGAITSLIGAIFAGILQLIQDGKIEIGWPILSIRDLIGYSSLVGCASG